MATFGALIERPACPPDRQAALLERNFVVRQHETHSLVLSEWFTECGAGAGMLDGDRLRARGRTQPAHAVGEPRRCQSHLRVAQRLAHLAEHRGGGQTQIVEYHYAVALHVVAIHGVHHSFEFDAGCVAVTEEQCRAARVVIVSRQTRHDDPCPRAVGSGDEPLASVDHVLAAIRTGLVDGFSLQLVGIRAGTSRFGHREHRSLSAVDHRNQELLDLFGVGDFRQDVHIALIRSGAVQRDRPER